jgi:MYXO-CTERM domain-containing protein
LIRATGYGSLYSLVARRAVFGGALVVALAFARGAEAETLVAAGGGTETWTRAGSPYVLVSDLEFDNLTVEAGTVVQMPSGIGQGTAITVMGSLTVNGIESEPVVFEQPGAGSVADASGGIRAGTFDVRGAVFRHCYFALSGGSTSTVSRITESVFEENTWAISTWGNVVIDRVAFVGNPTAVFGEPGESYAVTMSNSTVAEGNGLVFISSNATVSVTSSTFVDSPCPLASTIPSTLRNSIVSGGGFVSQSSAVELTHSILWQASNTTYPTIGEGVLREDPELVSATNFRLRPTSPAIDSGSPDSAPDHDFLGAPRPAGPGFDMGAYEHAPDDDGGEGGDAGASGAAGEGTSGGSGGAPSGGASGAGALGGGGATTSGGTAGAGGALSGGAGGTSDTTGGASGSKGKTVETTGCGCRMPRSTHGRGDLVALALTALAAFAVRRGNRRVRSLGSRSRSLRSR